MSTKTPAWKINPLPQSKHYVNSVAISAAGDKVLAGTYFFDYGASAGHAPAAAVPVTVGAFAWDNTGKPLWNHQFQSTEGVYWVAMSRDGNWAASCGSDMHNKGFIYAYDSAGTPTLLGNPASRTNVVALSADGSVLAAGADDIYIFFRKGSTWTAAPVISVVAHDDVTSISISSDGKWIVAGTYMGTVYLISTQNSAVHAHTTWQMPKSKYPGNVFWVSMSADGSTFAAAASNTTIYVFTTADFPTSKAPAWSSALAQCAGGCRAVAVSDDGQFISAVAASSGAKGGKLVLFSNSGSSGHQKWASDVPHAPNSTSIDATGKYITAATGHPDGTPGSFCLFDGTGKNLWTYATGNMSWPMVISPGDGGIAAGSDDSDVYYFSVP